jgi:DNA-binding PucR family transcriptional regulator
MAHVIHRTGTSGSDEPAHEAAGTTLDVAALLAEPLLRNALLAGQAGTGAPVEWCLPLSELEHPAADPGPHPGAVVHAHLTHLEGSSGADRIRRLADRKVAAVLVQNEHGAPNGPADWPTILPDARAVAEMVGLPLALLPAGADYRRVSQLVATKVLAQATHVLQYSDRVHRSLGKILALGAGIPALAYGMARISAAPVMVIDLDGAELGYEAPASSSKPESAPVAQVLSAHLDELLTGTDKPQTAAQQLPPLDVPGGIVVPIAAPVVFGRETSGLVAVLAPAESDAHDEAQRRIVAEEGAVLIGSEMLRIRSMLEAEERIRGDFVVALVHGRFQDAHQLLARARNHGFQVEARYGVHVAMLDPPLSDDSRAVRRMQAATRAVEKLDPDGGHTLATPVNGNLVVVRQVGIRAGSSLDALGEQEAVREFAENLRRLVVNGLAREARVAFGRVGVGAAGVAASYREARTALALGKRVGAAPVAGYDELRIFVALRDIADSDAGRGFAADVLAPLRRPDGNAHSLEEIVLAYISESGNLNAAARRLGLHRNTMLYKLGRASRVLGLDVRSAETQFMVSLAHHIGQLVDVNEQLDAELMPPPH